MGYRRPLKANEEVVVSSRGVLPKLDLKIGVVTGNTSKVGTGWLKYEVFFPELDESHFIYGHYLAPIENPTYTQREDYFHNARWAMLRVNPELKEKGKEVSSKSKEVGKLHREYQSLPEEERRALHSGALEPVKDVLEKAESEEEERNILGLLSDIGIIDINAPYPNAWEWEPYKSKALENRKLADECSDLEMRLWRATKEKVPNPWEEK